MMDIMQIIGAGGGGAMAAVLVYLKMIASRLDHIQDSIDSVGRKVDKLDQAVMDHEVRIRVMEKTRE